MKKFENENMGEYYDIGDPDDDFDDVNADSDFDDDFDGESTDEDFGDAIDDDFEDVEEPAPEDISRASYDVDLDDDFNDIDSSIDEIFEDNN